MTIYGIKNCNTMQKAFDYLDQKAVDYTFHDYKKAGISVTKIEEWFAKQPFERFINKQSQTWKKLDDSIKNEQLTSKVAAELMQQYTSLIRRPLIEHNDELLIGLDELVNRGI